jgi:hypothetical protein
MTPTGAPESTEKLKVGITECMMALERGLDKWFVTRVIHRGSAETNPETDR